MGIAAEVVFTMIILLVIGFFIYDRPWAGDKAVALISKLLINVSLPCMLLYSMVNSVTKEQLSTFGILIIITMIIIIITYYFSFLIAKIIKVKKGRQWTFAMMGSLSNSVFIGLPVCSMIYGVESVPIVMLGFTAGSFITLTLGISGIIKDATELGVENSHLNAITQIKNMFLNPIMLSLIIGLLLNILNIKYFPSLNNALKYISDTTTPLSLLFIGMFMRTMKLKEFLPDKDTFAVLIIRFIFAPLLAYYIYKGFNLLGMKIDDFSINVLVLQIACCVLTMTSIFAIEYKADGKFATKSVALSNIVFLFVLPIYIVLLT
ncbi:MAG: AEC family transporter [Pleomorphochaeta sp.]